MKKNIWILNHYAGNMFFDQGGRHYNFAKYLKQSGYEPVVFCANSNHFGSGTYFETDALWHAHLAEKIGVPFVFVSARAYVGNGKQRILNMVDFYRNVKKTAKAYAKQYGQPDVIYASSVHPLTLVAGIQLAKRFGVKCICEVRDLWPESFVAYGQLQRDSIITKALCIGEKWIYKKADSLIFTMENAYQYIKEHGWAQEIPESKVFYVNNGTDPNLFEANLEHFPVEDTDLDDPNIFKIVYTGSIRKVNNLGLLLDAAKRVTDPSVRFLIWGDGDELEFLRQRVAEENIQNIVFKGRVGKNFVPSIVSRADLNIAHNTPSSLFVYGISFNKLFDYLAAGKPILSDFPSGHNPAVVWGAGIEVSDPTPENIAQAIEDFVHMDKETYAQYSKNAATAAKAYSFEELTKKLCAIVEKQA